MGGRNDAGHPTRVVACRGHEGRPVRVAGPIARAERIRRARASPRASPPRAGSAARPGRSASWRSPARPAGARTESDWIVQTRIDQGLRAPAPPVQGHHFFPGLRTEATVREARRLRDSRLRENVLRTQSQLRVRSSEALETLLTLRSTPARRSPARRGRTRSRPPASRSLPRARSRLAPATASPPRPAPPRADPRPGARPVPRRRTWDDRAARALDSA
jgi:hypothetical protein